ncbi:uncharacterized protein CC84DRAFT_1214350 [Paraphaeosphaeria sporulosa]|uniref:Uncharacterized protein n=1 Tax=Paraphaeosphaeria sporulosa TaxID=1460663 RepID=A0A177CV58_9PLEO|nr:uncharacterized protein CC84DRAFT_1214350 [Paraphaeosphaeria sporulosa]OAG11101.1 hypothetical protein CC84DRAFT_1214350 [Paraphaeosphaeria sporulosa]
MSDLLSFLAFSKHIAALWSQDKRILYYRGKPIRIERFQQMARDLMAELEDGMWQKLLWVPDREGRFAIRLDLIQDDITLSRRGSYFVNEENGVMHGLHYKLERVMQRSEGRKLRAPEGQWNVWYVNRYLSVVTYFLEKKPVAYHVFNGQRARGSELATMRFRNGVLQDRNQPFAEYLQVKVLGGSFSDYIWADSHGPWGTDRLTPALKQETVKHLDVALNTREYLHVAVGIGRVAIGESFSRGY